MFYMSCAFSSCNQPHDYSLIHTNYQCIAWSQVLCKLYYWFPLTDSLPFHLRWRKRSFWWQRSRKSGAGNRCIVWMDQSCRLLTFNNFKAVSVQHEELQAEWLLLLQWWVFLNGGNDRASSSCFSLQPLDYANADSHSLRLQDIKKEPQRKCLCFSWYDILIMYAALASQWI